MRALQAGIRSVLIAVVAVLAYAVPGPPAQAAGAAFAPVAGSPYPGAPVASGSAGDNSIDFNASGTLAAITNWGAQTTTIDTVAPGGVLAPTGNAFSVSEPVLAQFSPNGQYLAIFSYNKGIYVFSVGSGGALTEVSGSPFVAVSGYGMAWSPDGSMLATVGNGPAGDGIVVYSVAGTGALTVAAQTFDTGNPIAVAFSPDDGLLAVANQNAKTVGLYTVGAGSKLTHVTDYSTGSSSVPYWVAFNPQAGGSGSAQLALADYGGNAVDLFAASQAGLTLESSTSTGPGSGPRAVAFSPDGLLATANAADGSVSVFQVSGTALSPTPGSPMISGVTPTVVAFTAGGGTLAVSNEYGDTVAAFSVAAPTLSFTGPENGAVYRVDQRVAFGYSCSDGPFAPGLSYCGAPGASTKPRYVATGRIGSFTLTESAQSTDGQRTAATVVYRVVGPAVSIVASRAAGPRAHVELRCRGGVARQACSGTVALVTARRPAGHRHPLTLGRARYRLRRGHRGWVAVRLTGAGSRLIAARHGRPLRLVVSATTAGRSAVRRSLRLG